MTTPNNSQIAITIKNDTNNELTKIKNKCVQPLVFEKFPDCIPIGGLEKICLDDPGDLDLLIQYQYEFKDQGLSISDVVEIKIKSHESPGQITISSSIIETCDEAYIGTDITTEYQIDDSFLASIYIGLNTILVVAKQFINFKNKILNESIKPEQIKSQVITQKDKELSISLKNSFEYYRASQVFNTKFQFHPLAIIYCETEQNVIDVFSAVTDYKLHFRVRSGGHDHEGESSGTNVIVIDLSKLNLDGSEEQVIIENDRVRISPGVRFTKLTSLLADKQVMIPHGTCASVGIAGFTMGGGWGPWTRQKGMCCESLIGATILLGDGEKHILSADSTNQGDLELLWALKGGGGLSYGIVTELVLETFKLPKQVIMFQLQWNPYKCQSDDSVKFLETDDSELTINVLKEWENVISNLNNIKNNVKLIGTNLKISAKNPSDTEKFNVNNVYHNCIMYGYFDGNEPELNQFIKDSFTNPPKITIDGRAGTDFPVKVYGQNLISNWDRESFYQVKRLLEGKKVVEGEGGTPIPPDLDDPAPHKITSRLVKEEGLGNAGHIGLLKSLTSSLILKGNREEGLFTYVTLGAITGCFYTDPPKKLNSAFPYKKSLYTIQYQTWWNDTLAQKNEGINNLVYPNLNRALDWMEDARSNTIANTSGAFISFKDNSIPTATYFAGSYVKLIEIKKCYSQDGFNYLRSRKTII